MRVDSKQNLPSAPVIIEKIHIPKIIHFIWAGGQRLMPKDGLKVMLAWAKQNPKFVIWLWVDVQTAPMKAPAHLQLRAFADVYYEKLLTALPKSEHDQLQVSSHDCQFGSTDPKIAPFIIKDINQEKVCTLYIRHEINRLQPNYGASSDLLRYRILEKFGGAYFDPDVAPPDPRKIPNAKPLQNLPLFYSKNLKQHTLFIEHITQTPYAETLSKELKNFEISSTKAIGNDSFIVTKNNPLMKLFYKEAVQNYNLKGLIEKNLFQPTVKNISLSNSVAQMLRIKFAYGANDREFYALNLTGPLHIRATLLCKKIHLQIKKNEILASFSHQKGDTSLVTLKPLRNGKYCLVEPLKNTLNWLKVFISPAKSIDSAIATVLKTIKFEAKHFSILRLEDHIDELFLAVQHIPINSQQIVRKLFLGLQALAIDWQSIKIAQINFSHREINRLYNHLQLNNKTGTFSKKLNVEIEDAQLSMIIECATSYNVLMNVTSRLLKHHKMVPACSQYTVRERREIISYFLHGLYFLNALVTHGTLYKLPASIKMCQQVFVNYQKFYTLIDPNTHKEWYLGQTNAELQRLQKIFFLLKQNQLRFNKIATK